MRVFLGIPIDSKIYMDDVESLRTQYNDINWTKPENYHITLKFFGEIEKNLSMITASAIYRYLEDIKPFDIDLTGWGSFSKQNKSTVLWGAVESKKLIEVHTKLDACFKELGFLSDDHKYVPHVTIGKSKNPIDFKMTSNLKKTISVNKLILYKSKPLKSGSKYIPIKEYSL